MRPTHEWSSTPSSQGSAASSSRFKEHLSLTIPPPDPSRERSRFSPDSPTSTGRTVTFSLGVPALCRFSPRSRPLDLEKGSTSSSSTRSTISSLGHHVNRLFFGLGAKEGDFSAQGVAPVPAAALALPPKTPEWPPLNVRKQATQDAPHDQPPTRIQTLRARAPVVALVAFLLYLFVNVVFLNVRLSALARMPAQLPVAVVTPPASAPTTTDTLPADTRQCIAQYTVDAPSDPTGYPCSACLPLLAALPPSATAVYPPALDAIQFCGLRSIWEGAGQRGQAGLEAGGWVKDIKFCTWAGVRCDGTGRVSSLQLTFPAVPVSLPAEFTHLTALEALNIVGDGNTPAGPFPVAFGALTMLTSLHLENTALGALPDTLQNITSLTLVRNAHVGSSLPPSVGNGNLRSLVVNEPLTLSAAQSTALCGGQLRTCDLRGSGIQACGACLVG
ncbi:hypothetical protein BJV78DRAFT_1283544 [Lactifluus subvellereus]|nr:hypothetical protein BJV78DRAFT_1283544 [Lactifluus subvellereus]